MIKLMLGCWLGLILAVPGGVMASQGAYSPVPVDNDKVMAAAEFAVATQQKILQEENESEPVHLELVKILSARQQVVSGLNYELRLKVSLDGKEKEVKAIVWWQAWRKPDPYRLILWKEMEKAEIKPDN